MAKELTAAHYRQLFAAHPERTLLSWAEFSDILDTADVGSAAFADVVERAVPKREDRFELLSIDRPLAGAYFGSRQDLTDTVLGYVQGDLRRRADPYFSADAAVFDTLLTVYGVLAVALTTGKISAADRIRLVEGQFHGFFSFLASGPPPRRLEELIALHRAGLVQFAGPDFAVDVVDGAFSGSSPAAPGSDCRPGAGRRPVAQARRPRRHRPDHSGSAGRRRTGRRGHHRPRRSIPWRWATARRLELPRHPSRRFGAPTAVPARAIRVRLRRVGGFLPTGLQRRGLSAERCRRPADSAAAR